MEDPTGRFGPKPEPPLQLELEKRAPSTPSMSAANASSQRAFYPETESERAARGRTTKRLVLAVVALLVLGGAAIAGKRHLDLEAAAERAAAAAKAAREDAELLKELAAPKNAPSCWVGNGGFMFVYEEKGTSVIVESIQDVPVDKRRSAKCLKQ